MIDEPSQVAPSVDDYRWLVEGPGQPWLESTINSAASLSRLAKQLRRDLSVTQTHLVLEQTRLRSRARVKFSDADRMFFTTKSLEQSTAAPIAAHKASRFSDGRQVADLCCGIGGDLIAFSQRGPSIGVERDEVLAYLALANCHALGLEAQVATADVDQLDLESHQAIHIDPDRRPAGRKSVRLEHHEPSRSTLEKLICQAHDLAIKLAPATEIDSMLSQAELEWIGWRRECQQLIAWFGSVAPRAGRRRATVVTASEPRTLTGDRIEPSHTEQVERFVVEPHAAILAADLAGQLAANHGLQALTARGGYLTGSVALDSAMATSYEVTDVLAYRPKRVKAILRQRQIGELVVKKRGVPQTPSQVQRDCMPTPFGDGQAVLILTKIGLRITAILAKPAQLHPERSGDDAALG